jgi:hypothetical protein
MESSQKMKLLYAFSEGSVNQDNNYGFELNMIINNAKSILNEEQISNLCESLKKDLLKEKHWEKLPSKPTSSSTSSFIPSSPTLSSSTSPLASFSPQSSWPPSFDYEAVSKLPNENLKEVLSARLEVLRKFREEKRDEESPSLSPKNNCHYKSIIGSPALSGVTIY